MLQWEALERHMVPTSAALIGKHEEALSLVEKARESFDAHLVAEPEPESESARIARELGVA